MSRSRRWPTRSGGVSRSNRSIVRDGLVIGRWWRGVGPRSVTLRLEPRVSTDSGDRRRLQKSVERYAAFLGRPVEVTGLD